LNATDFDVENNLGFSTNTFSPDYALAKAIRLGYRIPYVSVGDATANIVDVQVLHGKYYVGVISATVPDAS